MVEYEFPPSVVHGAPFGSPEEAVVFFNRYPGLFPAPRAYGMDAWTTEAYLVVDHPNEIVELPMVPGPYDGIDEDAFTESPAFLADNGRQPLNASVVAFHTGTGIYEFDDLPGRRIGFVPWSGVLPDHPNPVGARLVVMRRLAGWEAAARRALPVAKSRGKAAAVLEQIEKATVQARQRFTQAANTWASTVWIDLVLSGADVIPTNPNASGATSAGTSPTGTVRLGLTS